MLKALVSDRASGKMAATGLVGRDLLSLLQVFPSGVLDSLYKSVPACLAVYRYSAIVAIKA